MEYNFGRIRNIYAGPPEVVVLKCLNYFTGSTV